MRTVREAITCVRKVSEKIILCRQSSWQGVTLAVTQAGYKRASALKWRSPVQIGGLDCARRKRGSRPESRHINVTKVMLSLLSAGRWFESDPGSQISLFAELAVFPAGAVVIDVALLLNLADHRAAALGAGDQTRESEVVRQAAMPLSEAAVEHALHALP